MMGQKENLLLWRSISFFLSLLTNPILISSMETKPPLLIIRNLDSSIFAGSGLGQPNPTRLVFSLPHTDPDPWLVLWLSYQPYSPHDGHGLGRVYQRLI